MVQVAGSRCLLQAIGHIQSPCDMSGAGTWEACSEPELESVVASSFLQVPNVILKSVEISYLSQAGKAK